MEWCNPHPTANHTYRMLMGKIKPSTKRTDKVDKIAGIHISKDFSTSTKGLEKKTDGIIGRLLMNGKGTSEQGIKPVGNTDHDKLSGTRSSGN
jgi:hypothetical protein